MIRKIMIRTRIESRRRRNIRLPVCSRPPLPPAHTPPEVAPGPCSSTVDGVVGAKTIYLGDTVRLESRRGQSYM